MEKRLLNKVLRVVMGVSLFHLFTFSPLPALADESIDLKSLYQQIDEAISLSPQYVAERERQITACRDSLQTERNAEKSILLAEKLFFLYEPYRNDSALYFADYCINLADSLRRPDITGRFRSLLAYQCSRTDKHAESMEQLRLVNKSALDKRGLVDYYHAWMHVCGELGVYTQREAVRQRAFKQQDLYRDSVLMVTEEGSEEWYHLEVDILSARKLYQDAMEISDQWLQNVTDGTHESAYAAFYRSMIYDRLNNHDLVCYWLGKSALDDIKCAVMNQASLLFLAEHLANDGDTERAHRYMEFAKDCNLTFAPQLRNYQVNPIVNIVEKNCHDTLARADRILKIAIGVIVLLLIALLYTLSVIRKTRSKGTQ
jgi:hypothetical protein